jgi:hypothetical protein
MTMKTGFLMRAVGGLAALTLSSGVFAATLWLNCSHCDSTNAQQFAEQSRYTGTVMVYNLNNRFRAKFETQAQVTGVGCRQTSNKDNAKPKFGFGYSPQEHRLGYCSNVVIATPAVPGADENELMRILQILSDNTGGSMRVKIEMDGLHIQGTAHDFPNSAEFKGRTRRDLERLLYTPTAADQYLIRGLDKKSLATMMNIIRDGGHNAIGGAFNLITVVITYVDGSTVTVKFDADRISTLERALSAEGREIMTKDNIEGFTHEPLPMANELSLRAFLKNAQRLRIGAKKSAEWRPDARIVRCSAEVEFGRVVPICTAQ